MFLSLQSILNNQELVSNIASFAYWGRNVPDTPLQLWNVLALGLTCKALLGPCLDQLWRRQLNLFNLFKTLPQDAWEVYDGDFVGPDGERQQCIKTRRVILPTDWVSFDFYAHKIRELGFDPRMPSVAPQSFEYWRPTGVPMNAFMALCVVRLPRELLPNIRRIRWTTHEYFERTHIHVYILLNVPLVSLCMDYREIDMKLAPPEPEPEPEAGEGDGNEEGDGEGEGEGGGGEGEQQDGEAAPEDDLPPPRPLPPAPRGPPPLPPPFEGDIYLKYTLKAVIEECPNIRDIEIVAPHFQGYRWAIEEFIRQGKDKKLRTFAINLQDWEEEDLVCLAGSPTLRKTRIFLRDTDCAWLVRAMESGTPFANVRELTVGAPSFEFFTAFFLQFDGSRLEKLALDATERPTAEVLHTCLSTVAASCSVANLRAFSLSDHAPPTKADAAPDGSPSPARGDVFMPLTTFVHLHVFKLDLSGPYALDNAGLATLVSAWPALERLTLGSKHGWGTRSVLTFAGLAKVLALCPRLEQLAISIDTTVDDLGAGPGARNAIVATVHLLDSFVVDHPDVGVAIARNLSALFSDLLFVRAWTKLEPKPEQGEQMNVEDAGHEPGRDGAKTPQGHAPPQLPQAEDGDVQMGDETASVAAAEATVHNDRQPEVAAGGEGDQAQPGAEEVPVRMVEWLASREFWETVEKQVATFSLLRDMGIPMDLS